MNLLKKKKAALLFLAAFMLLFTKKQCQAAENPDNEGNRILFISSYSYSWQSVPKQIQGLEEELGIDYVVNYEFMDTKNTLYSEDYKEFYDMLKFKLMERDPYDAVIAGDDAALNFVKLYQKDLFKDTPIVFEGIDDVENAVKFAKNPWITGVVEKVDYKTNIELARKIFPEATRLVFIVDNSENGKGIQKQLESFSNEFLDYEIEYINSGDYTREELEKKLMSLDSSSIAFVFSISQRKDGSIYTEDERNQILENYIQIPVFRVSSSEIGKCDKILGGYVVDHEECGKIAGEVVKKVIGQEDISKMPVMMNTPQMYCFNDEAIRLFELNRRLFPKEAEYLNTKPSFLQVHYKYAIGVAVFLVFVMLLVSLFNSHRGRIKQEKLNKKLDESNEELNRRNQELEKKNSELAEVSAYKSRFLSRVSHDIRTPMNSIINLTNMIEEELEDKKAIRRDLKKIKASNRFLLTLVNDILDMSVIEQKKIELHPERYSYSDFYDYIQSTFEPMCKEKNISLDMQKNQNRVDIVIDKQRFKQMCFNLLANAVKYTPKGGKISFDISQGKPEDGVIPCDIYVRDNGIGMNKEFQKKMFEPFAQEGREYATVEGTGLGLSIVREIVDLFGATIEVDSEENKGTSVHVHINMTMATSLDKFKEEILIEEEKLSGRHILVAEDHPLNQEIIKRLLEKVHMHVTITNNGKETLDEFTEHPDFYDAILMDIRMPVMDGITATKEIRKLRYERAVEIPIIALTANAFAQDQEETFRAGMNAHLSKPIDTRLLFETLERCIC